MGQQCALEVDSTTAHFIAFSIGFTVIIITTSAKVAIKSLESAEHECMVVRLFGQTTRPIP